MIKNDFINDFIGQASKLLPNQQNIEELQKNLQVMAQATLARLDLVTREEFDAQTQVLQRTRAKVEELEKELQSISERINKK